MTKLYYSPPSDECFEDLRAAAIAVWGQYDNAFGYVDEKVSAIKDIKNVSDNFMYIFAMFDMINQQKVAGIISESTKREINVRLIDGGSPEYMLI